MKKILMVSLIAALSTNMVLAASSYGTSLKNAVKQDIKATKEAVKKDMDNKQKANTAASDAKKAEKIKQIDAKIAELNKEMTSVKNSKELSETEKTIKMNSLQRQINFYTKQKEALK